ncbi:tRNA (adenosine(37)-N6)-threonylcarbamoyltransferase complex transferase subunit TsaD [Methyloligella sp. 2.7D]|uniref:tRNA (adenosine(37)-N6)-threonylcarbamoyltransferase complex transferase subunit TsaD n=1 Tax=unclassified Methyloligella TaxID=2625955 RepID=UPI00157D0DE5|nr:tRNA (adenosine(37)-N6)-threonylcarbamoyltransferase complex transferase subunit TsaD [Methyloligella sp. GL2]QKP78654.1 tRNA (adenosine(37)-N6)-threonylcarbamoyltransferase complex transferase subunit TsaD [Methyloligella sp. GL2]
MDKPQLTVLGIETSCDETAASVVVRDEEGRGHVLSNIVRSQLDLHRRYGGVVPEIAARAHVELLDAAIAQALEEAGVSLSDLDGIAVTAGPGLIGGLIVGLTTGKALALASRLPFIAVNHLEAHALTARLTDGVPFPYLLLLVSGGHTQLLVAEGVGRYSRLGTTLDDALGEAFDKAAKLLGLDYPGGPEVEKLAAQGTDSIPLPRPMLGRTEPHFSLAGLKTAVRHAALQREPLDAQTAADLCASFQEAVAEVVQDRTRRAMGLYLDRVGEDAPRNLVVAGGVAANQRLRSALQTLCDAEGFGLFTPPLALCSDNGAMIAWAGLERLAAGLTDDMHAPARARWPLDPEATPALGAGVKA